MPATAKTHYQVLGVSESASVRAVKRAYRALVQRTHPDHGGSRTEFEAVQASFEVLSNAPGRREYDNELAESRAESSRPRHETPNPPPHAPEPAATPPDRDGMPNFTQRARTPASTSSGRRSWRPDRHVPVW